MSRAITAALGVALAAAIGAVSAHAATPVGAAGSPAADTGYFQEIVPVSPGVWVLAEPRFQVQPIGNVTVIEQADGLVLVDAGGSAGSGRRIVEMVRSLSPKPVKAIILSQWHGDKVQGLSELLKAWPGARTIATVQARAELADPKTMNSPAAPDAARNAATIKQYLDVAASLEGQVSQAHTEAERQGLKDAAAMIRQYALDIDGTLTLPPTESFTDRLVIADPVRPVEALYLGPADTDGDAVVWLPKQKVLAAGETVIAPFPYGFGSDPASWLDVLAKLRAMPFRTLIPGHGAPEHDRAQLDRTAAALREVRTQVAALAAQGLTLQQVQARIDLTASRKSFIGDDPWLAHWFKRYWADPAVASAYKEAKGEPIVQSLGG